MKRAFPLLVLAVSVSIGTSGFCPAHAAFWNPMDWFSHSSHAEENNAPNSPNQDGNQDERNQDAIRAADEARKTAEQAMIEARHALEKAEMAQRRAEALEKRSGHPVEKPIVSPSASEAFQVPAHRTDETGIGEATDKPASTQSTDSAEAAETPEAKSGQASAGQNTAQDNTTDPAASPLFEQPAATSNRQEGQPVQAQSASGNSDQSPETAGTDEKNANPSDSTTPSSTAAETNPPTAESAGTTQHQGYSSDPIDEPESDNGDSEADEDHSKIPAASAPPNIDPKHAESQTGRLQYAGHDTTAGAAARIRPNREAEQAAEAPTTTDSSPSDPSAWNPWTWFRHAVPQPEEPKAGEQHPDKHDTAQAHPAPQTQDNSSSRAETAETKDGMTKNAHGHTSETSTAAGKEITSKAKRPENETPVVPHPWNPLNWFREPAMQATGQAAPAIDAHKQDNPTPAEQDKAPQATAALIETEQGSIGLELYPDQAPVTVANFVKLVHNGFYNRYNMRFHRVVPGFVVQTGDPTGTGAGGSPESIPLEVRNRLSHNVKGIVAMARGIDPHSATSQFYITLTPQPTLDGKYAIFGKVISGLDVLNKIEKGTMLYGIKLVDVNTIVRDPESEKKHFFF